MNKGLISGIAIMWSIGLIGFMSRTIDNELIALTATLILPICITAITIYAIIKGEKEEDMDE